jgi:predicted Rossmann-fold nucleotide-binding protein
MFTWAQLGLHHKPIGLLNIDDYWQPLLAFIDHMVAERFLWAEHRDALLVSTDAPTLVDQLAAYEPRVKDKWLDRDA